MLPPSNRCLGAVIANGGLFSPRSSVVLVDDVDGVVVGRHGDGLAGGLEQALCPLLRPQVPHLREDFLRALAQVVSFGVLPPERDV